MRLSPWRAGGSPPPPRLPHPSSTRLTPPTTTSTTTGTFCAATPRKTYPPAYRRPDFATTHADAALRAFAAALAAGPASLDGAAAWLAAGAEDDALATNSPVPLPTAAFECRLDRLASDAAAALRAGLPSYSPASPDRAHHQAALDLITAAVFGAPPGGGSPFRLVPGTALAAGAVLDAPGTVEGADPAYLHAALTTRTATPSTAAILLAAVQARLVRAGHLGAVARVSWVGGGPALLGASVGGLSLAVPPPAPPRATVAVCSPGVRRPDGSPLSALPLAALVESNARLLRSFWPGPWATPALLPDPAHTTGGSALLAAALIGEGDSRAGSAELVAISRAAAHRLERGVFTSPGAGDGRRALAAARRGVLLAEAGGGGPDAAAAPRREYGVLLAAAGRAAEAAAELGAFLEACSWRRGEEEEGGQVARLAAAQSAAAGGGAPPAVPISIAGVLAAPPVAAVDDESAQIPW